MTICTSNSTQLSRCKRRKVTAAFEGGNVTSDGGCLLLREAEKKLGLIKEVAKRLPDTRRKSSVEHSYASILKQRVMGMALGYEDQNDHNELRNDLALQTAIGRVSPLASQATINRFENSATEDWAWIVHEVLIEKFISSYDVPPRRIILDFDATDDPIHGHQIRRAFNGYYDCYCFLPLYVFCGQHLLAAYLRPSKIDGARNSRALLKLLVQRIRKDWPGVTIVLRGDCGFNRGELLRWCENNNIYYVIGFPKNKRIDKECQKHAEEAKRRSERRGRKVRVFGELLYQTKKSWKCSRRIIVRAESENGEFNPRYVVTNLKYSPKHIYTKLYCARGDMENRIKEQQLHLFADRTSAHEWWPNQFRLLLSSLAYTLVDFIRREALSGTEMARAQCNTIRLKLFKIGAIITRNTRRIVFLLSASCPYQELFNIAAARLCKT